MVHCQTAMLSTVAARVRIMVLRLLVIEQRSHGHRAVCETFVQSRTNHITGARVRCSTSFEDGMRGSKVRVRPREVLVDGFNRGHGSDGKVQVRRDVGARVRRECGKSQNRYIVRERIFILPDVDTKCLLHLLHSHPTLIFLSQTFMSGGAHEHHRTNAAYS